MYDERDVRAAGQALANLDVDLGDVVDVQLPAYRDIPERDPEEWHRPDWRRTLMSWMVERARFKLVQENRPYEEWGDWRAIGGNGLPGGLTWEEFVAYSSQARHLQNIASTRPLQLLAWNGETWLLPRAFTELLDRWEQKEGELVDQARLCRCGAQGPYLDRVLRGEADESLVAAQGGGKAEKGQVVAGIAFVARAQVAVAGQPGHRPLDDPSAAP